MNLFLSKIKTSLDRWMAFLTRCDLVDSVKFPEELKDAQLKKALNVLNVMQFDEKERTIYEGHLKWLRDEANALLKAEEKGEARGREKGIEKVAINMLKKHIDISEISSITELSIAHIEKLKKKLL